MSLFMVFVMENKSAMMILDRLKFQSLLLRNNEKWQKY